MDMTAKSERLPAPGETIIGGTFLMNPGGKGANQVVAAARLGGNVSFVANKGDDIFGKQLVDLYKSEGIGTDYIFTDADNSTGVALIMVDAKAENCIVVASAANGTLTPEKIEEARPEIESASILLMQLEIPVESVEHAAEIAFQKGIKVILNPAPAPAQPLSDKLLQCLHIIIPNGIEAEMLSGVKVSDWESAKAAADVISAKGVDIVVLTLGSRGALVKEGDRYYEIPAEKVTAVDTTAAGDTFCGALAVGLSEGLSVVDAVKLACKAAAISVTRVGSLTSTPYRKELEN
jgi:ribokinase